MRLEEILQKIYHLHFKTQRDLASTFLRFQEYYESPKFRKKIFTLKEYKEWYKKNSKNGKFTYYSDWSGFNIPSYILKQFYNGKFNPLSKKEINFLKLFNKLNGEFYIIGTYGTKRALKHEIAHGLFYINKKYKREVLKVLSRVNNEVQNKINKYLSSSGGYHKNSWKDETHAYLLTNTKQLKKEGINKEVLMSFKKELSKIYKKYS